MEKLHLLDDLSICQLVLHAGLDQVQHALLHVRGEGVVVDLRVVELAGVGALLINKMREFLQAERQTGLSCDL